ncbi:tyrosine-protein phosphatase [Myxococcota bacterium]|nr:tyrosine-protein phosphatase [Myxococcota bacterium]
MQTHSPPSRTTDTRGWPMAGLFIALQGFWLILASAAQTVTLRLEEFLETIGVSEETLPILLDAWVLVPIWVLGIAGVGILHRSAPEGAAPWARGLVVVFSVAASMFFLDHRDFLLHRMGVVRDGVLYRSAQLSGSVLKNAIDEFDIRTVVVLRDSPEILERESLIAENKGIRLVHIPMQDIETGTRTFIELMQDSNSHPVLAHCRHGVSRTGLAAAAYRIKMDDWDNSRALSEARLYGGYDTLEPGSRKRQFILEYEASREPDGHR